MDPIANGTIVVITHMENERGAVGLIRSSYRKKLPYDPYAADIADPVYVYRVDLVWYGREYIYHADEFIPVTGDLLVDLFMRAVE